MKIATSSSLIKYLLITTILFFINIQTIDPNLFVISIPKAGTHLALRCLHELTNYTHMFAKDFLGELNQQEIKSLDPNKIIVFHANPTDKNIELLKECNLKGVFISRDPRDTIISQVYWIYAHPTDWPELQKLTFDELVTKFINEWTLELYRSLIPWRNVNQLIYHTTFEKLVGPNGGGSLELQLTEINNIAKHFNIEINETLAKEVAQKMWGEEWSGDQRWTFRQGKIGSWKQHFKDYHITEFKQKAGDLLIELGYETNLDW